MKSEKRSIQESHKAVRESTSYQRFPCDNCGLCCRNLKLSHAYDDLHDGTGVCRYLEVNTNLCTIYNRRPYKCNIVKSYKYFKNALSFDSYIRLNIVACNKLKEENNMPIPIVLGLAGLAVSGVLGHCAKEVNDDYEYELNSINRSMKELASATHNKAEESKRKIENITEKLISQKKKIYEVTLTNFSEVFSQLKNVEFDNDIQFKANVLKIEQKVIEFKDNSSHSYGFWDDTKANVVKSILLGGGITIVTGLVKGVRLQYKIDEANAEYSKLKAECEVINRECVKVDSIGAYCNRAYSTISLLTSLTNKSIEQLSNIISRLGTDYSMYGTIERNEIRVCTNFVKALNDIADIQIFTNNGEINPQLRKYIDGVSNITISEAR